MPDICSAPRTATTFGRSVFLPQGRGLVVERVVCILSRPPPDAMSTPSVRILGINSLPFAEMHMAAKKAAPSNSMRNVWPIFSLPVGGTNRS